LDGPHWPKICEVETNPLLLRVGEIEGCAWNFMIDVPMSAANTKISPIHPALKLGFKMLN
jgi:hypothetical protein